MRCTEDYEDYPSVLFENWNPHLLSKKRRNEEYPESCIVGILVPVGRIEGSTARTTEARIVIEWDLE